MARYYLINQVQGVGASYLPGSVVDSAVGDLLDRICSAGGLLVPVDVPLVAKAAELANAVRSSGAPASAMESIMVAAVQSYSTAASARWQAQPQWYIDEINGDDGNDGAAAATAIRTFAEFRRRVAGRVIGPQVDVYFLSDITEPVIVDFECLTGFWLHGQRRLLYAGSVTGFQAANYATDTEAQITDSALPVGWAVSGLENKLIVLTSGPYAGAAGYLGSDLGAKTALFQRLLHWGTFALVEPTVGDTFEVYDQTVISGGCWIGCVGGLFAQDLRFTNPTGWALSVYLGQFIPVWCSVTGAALGVTDWCDFYSCFIRAGYVLIARGGYCSVFFGSVIRPIGSGVSVHSGALLEIDDATIFDGVDSPSMGIQVALGGSLYVAYDPIGFVQFPAGSKPLVVENGGAVRFKAGAWGSLNNAPDHWLWVNSAGRVTKAAAASLHVQGGTVSDVLVGVTAGTNAQADAGIVDATTGALCVPEAF